MKKLILGVTGGVGAGKSTVLSILKEEYQAYVIEADAVGRRLEERGQPGYDVVLREFGGGILAPDGEIDRGKLSALVFADADALKRLNGLLHPMIYEEIQAEIRRECEKNLSETEKDGQTKFFVLEAAILFETGFDRCCDFTVYVYADEGTRIARLRESRGYSEEKAAGVIANQLGDEEFRARADYVIENGGDLEETKRQICSLVKSLSEGVLFYGNTDMA
ncbi:MAG: dephospho-CoA kinase [Lachnospiraceae bacterium]|nr:dephospho-CoA kinase [Lachnospiraceae bacterium]